MKSNLIGVIMLSLFGCVAFGFAGFVATEAVKATDKFTWVPAIFFAVLGLFFFISAIVVGGERRREQARLARLRDWAQSNGWQMYEGEQAASWLGRLPIPPRDKLEIKAVLYRQFGRASVTIAKCTYEKITTDNDNSGRRRTVPLCFTALTLPGQWPDIGVRPAPRLFNLALALARKKMETSGYDGPLIERDTGYPDFDRRYLIYTSVDRATVRTIVSQPLILAHVRDEVPPWQVTSGQLWFEDEVDVARTPEMVPQRAQVVQHIASLLGPTSA